jgi:LPS-assembly lipoprotein
MSLSERKPPHPNPPPQVGRGPIALGNTRAAENHAPPSPRRGGGLGWGGLRLPRRAVLFGMLAGCGFTPSLGPGGAAEGLQGAIRVNDPGNKNAFDLVERLEERIGRPATARFDLGYTITTGAIGVGITPDNAITRYNLTGRVDWTLTERATGTRVAGGRVNSFTSYSATGSTVAGLAAEEDAAFRLMRILADQIVSRLIASAGDWL